MFHFVLKTLEFLSIPARIYIIYKIYRLRCFMKMKIRFFFVYLGFFNVVVYWNEVVMLL